MNGLCGGLGEATKQTAENDRHGPKTMMFTDSFTILQNIITGIGSSSLSNAGPLRLTRYVPVDNREMSLKLNSCRLKLAFHR